MLFIATISCKHTTYVSSTRNCLKTVMTTERKKDAERKRWETHKNFKSLGNGHQPSLKPHRVKCGPDYCWYFPDIAYRKINNQQDVTEAFQTATKKKHKIQGSFLEVLPLFQGGTSAHRFLTHIFLFVDDNEAERQSMNEDLKKKVREFRKR